MVQSDVEVPEHLGEHETQLGVSQVLSNAVAYADGPGLVRSVVVLGVKRLVEMTLRDEGLRVAEVVAGKVGAEMRDADTGLEKPSVGTRVDIGELRGSDLRLQGQTFHTQWHRREERHVEAGLEQTDTCEASRR